MIEWVTLQGEGPAIVKWLMWARKQARFMLELKTRPAKRVRMADGTDVAIEVRDGQAFIRIAGGGSGTYQFWGSGERFYKDYPAVSHYGLTRYLPRGYGVSVDLVNRKFRGKALGASFAPPDPDAWRYDPDPKNTDDYMLIAPSHQPDGAGMRYGFRGWTKRLGHFTKMIGSAWAPSHPCHGFGRLGTASRTASYETDLGNDYPAVLYRGAKGAERGPPVDFWRGACIREVNGIEFVIMVDAANTFVAFRANDIVEPFDIGVPGKWPNVELDACKTVACPWPAWAVVPDWTETLDLTLMQPRWEFHPDGARAVCVVGKRQTVWSDARYESAVYNVLTGALQYKPIEDTPGLVEVDFDIALSGSDFTFTVTLKQSIDGATNNRQPVAAAYARCPMPDASGTKDAIPYGALLILDYDHYWSRYWLPPDSNGRSGLLDPVRATVARIRLESGTVVREWLAYYGCYPTSNSIENADYPFYPRMHEFPEVGGVASDYRTNYFSFIGHVCSLDLASLSVCIGSSLWTGGRMSAPPYTVKAAEAAELRVIAFNKEKESKSVGHTILKKVVFEMARLKGDYPNLAGMDALYASTTISAVEQSPIPPIDRVSSYNLGGQRGEVNYASMTISQPGASVTRNVYDAAEGLDPDDTLTSRFYAIEACGLFPDATEVFGPRPFAWIDQFCVIRPGMGWFINAERQPGDMTYSNYPFGAINHSSIHQLTLTPLANSHTKFAVHPDKSWAIFCGPIGAHTDILIGATNPNYEQDLIDIISITTPYNKEARTTHVSMINAAFNLGVAKEDYYFDIRDRGDGYPQMRPNSIDPTEHSWYDIIAPTPIGIGWRSENRVDGRLLREFTFDPQLYVTSRYGTYSGFRTFPSPRIESVFFRVK